MSISEIFDHGVPIPWANIRANNLSVDGSITQDTGYTTLVGKLNGVSDTSAHTILTIPLNPNASYYAIFTAVCYTPTTSPGYGCTSQAIYNISTVGGVIGYLNQIGSTTTNRYGYPNTLALGLTISNSGLNIICQIINAFPSNVSDWVIYVQLLGPVT